MGNFFEINRKKLYSKMENNSCIVLNSGCEKQKSGDENYPFCVNKNFYYLTGLEKPNIYLVMEKYDNDVCRERIITPTFKESAWVTPNYKMNEITKISNVLEVIYYDELDLQLNQNLKIYTDFKNEHFYSNFPLKNVNDCFEMIARLRAVKSSYEIRQIKQAIEITRQGLLNVFSNLSKCNYEYQVQALFEGAIKFNNSQDLAFATICASGKNACTLHYSKNTDELVSGDLILLDLGARYGQYSADISRTIPYNSKFSPMQKKLYNMVLKGQKIGFKMAKPGVTIYEINNALIDYYFIELSKLKLVETKEDVKKYYMHNIGHSLGLDTHDEGLFRGEKLVEGNIITMEPGIYIPEYRIGIRIEDDVLITKDGCKILSKSIPKTISDIEKILK